MKRSHRGSCRRCDSSPMRPDRAGWSADRRSISKRPAIERFASELGLAFQIVDDILDVEGASDALGKTAGKDAAAGKPTYPALFGLEASRRMAADCVARALGALEPV